MSVCSEAMLSLFGFTRSTETMRVRRYAQWSEQLTAQSPVEGGQGRYNGWRRRYLNQSGQTSEPFLMTGGNAECPDHPSPGSQECLSGLAKKTALMRIPGAYLTAFSPFSHMGHYAAGDSGGSWRLPPDFCNAVRQSERRVGKLWGSL